MAEWQYLIGKQISYSCIASYKVIFLAGKDVLLRDHNIALHLHGIQVHNGTD
jgi:hypothetical protein